MLIDIESPRSSAESITEGTITTWTGRSSVGDAVTEDQPLLIELETEKVTCRSCLPRRVGVLARDRGRRRRGRCKVRTRSPGSHTEVERGHGFRSGRRPRLRRGHCGASAAAAARVPRKTRQRSVVMVEEAQASSTAPRPRSPLTGKDGRGARDRPRPCSTLPSADEARSPRRTGLAPRPEAQERAETG